MYGAPVGTSTFTEPGFVIPITHKGRVFNIHIIAAATTTVKLLDNGSAGALKIQEISPPNASGTLNNSIGATRDYGINGILFNDGAYLALTSGTSLADGNTRITISYRQEEKNVV